MKQKIPRHATEEFLFSDETVSRVLYPTDVNPEAMTISLGRRLLDASSERPFRDTTVADRVLDLLLHRKGFTTDPYNGSRSIVTDGGKR